MNKMKCFSAALVAFFLSATHLCAQDIEKEFDDFAKQQQQEFEDFKNKADLRVRPIPLQADPDLKHEW